MSKKSLFIGILLFCMVLVSACASDNKEEEAVIFDAGSFSVTVPTGWSAFNVEDVLDEYDGNIKPNSVYIIKDGSASYDIITKQYVLISHKETGYKVYDSSVYANVEVIEEFTLGDTIWEGFSAENDGSPIVVLNTKDADDGTHIYIKLLAEDESMIEYDDIDIENIMKSIQYQ